MAGYVNAHLQINNFVLSEVLPDLCPAADEHTAGGVRCLAELPGGEVRACLYYLQMTESGNVTNRVHFSTLAQKAMRQSQRQIRCGVLCQRQRGNRPPGC